MKKLIITAIAICTSVVTQAAVANWKANASNIYDGTGSTDTSAKYSGAAYIFNAGITSQSALYALIAADVKSFDATTTAGYAASGTIASGTASNFTFSYGEQSASSTDLNNYSFYFVLIDDDKAYFSATKDVSASALTSAKIIAFGSQATGSQLAPAATGYAGDGKWSSVPEPTSAMLLMLGLCGLALKRKNA